MKGQFLREPVCWCRLQRAIGGSSWIDSPAALVCSFLLRITPALTLTSSQAASPLDKAHITPISCLLELLSVVDFDAGIGEL